ncbi:LacI family DNA-binding transcriptional regulator [Streptococcus equi subsp. zooepidemicus]|uniref:LacI family DNA-binding transcriptional regulator n=1 Tax=Streptococcus equi TaxID=1336 RepID=UPI0013F664DE|nr:LacI family DNA-binding transcriptional regulator [Streptococcus equi]MCD3432934.1 LacI family DNA-binding transcriptional regulator [Streptococcus equi subsp. zooepidemicus]MDI5954472.1 LacI family DNA-binding transcriptional regulator [Streptococcus equi subsp. zooepidemicus]QTZ59676.1 HTH-type transcriptional regulator MalR [Streptococcus equi subsp. zooepidemicus]QUF62379.1 LacI family DNA-binding transcriptional regulator [Streptococcus equi subsp. zooepidemicus]QWN61023.1 LacI family 
MVTIKDVARLAGVSPSTASRAINDSDMISQATKERVKKAMEALDYSPNYSAQNLVKRKSNTVGIILPVREGQDSLGNNPFFMQIIQGIAAVCTDQSYMVALATGRSETELLKNVQNMIRSGNIGKLIFLYSKTDDQVFDFVKKQRVDCVVVGQSTTKDSGNAKFVNNNNHQAGYDAAAFLLQKGFEEIIYAYTDMDELVQAERYKGYAELMTSKALAAQALCVMLKDDRKSQKQLLDQLAKRSKVAFVVCDDVLAIHLQRLIKQVAADTQLAIVSFNNSVLAELASPALTSIDIFPYQLGEQAAELVLSSAAPSPQPVLVPHQIIERESTPFIV